MNAVSDYFEGLVSTEYRTPKGLSIMNYSPPPIPTTVREGNYAEPEPNSTIWQYYLIGDAIKGFGVAIVSIGNSNHQINFRDTDEMLPMPTHSKKYSTDYEAIEWAKMIIDKYY